MWLEHIILIRAFTYSWNGSSWNQEASLSGSTYFGWDVSMSNGGDTIAVSSLTSIPL